ncbi:hypothetical protein LSH36_375g03010 [Paralvinella palmiformis]|uniref:Uncharacterized protein n=1 Tax=Paralvinella palmiformis TaxID=53620 RepID=A0AAD9JDJ7_9ANNE|nr:hypothetical protein LSH36_375g03010 [Paralvinella palmiformis]
MRSGQDVMGMCLSNALRLQWQHPWYAPLEFEIDAGLEQIAQQRWTTVVLGRQICRLFASIGPASDRRWLMRVDGVTWLKNKANPTRGFIDDGDNAVATYRKPAQQKVTLLEIMFGQVANFYSVISRNQLIKSSTSIDTIWQSMRGHLGFQSNSGHLLTYLEPGERAEDLFQRLVAFVDDNLLTTAGGIAHHGEAIPEDEELSPTLENIIILTWLRLLHKDLSRLVKQRCGTELRSRTLASIQPEISQAMDTLLDEVQLTTDACVLKSTNQYTPSRNNNSPHKPSRQHLSNKSGSICKQAGRQANHFLSRCQYLPDDDRKYLTKVCQIAAFDEDNDDDQISTSLPDPPPTINRMVQVKQSPYVNVYYGPDAIQVTLETGADTNMIRLALANNIQAPIKKSTQIAYQDDVEDLDVNVLGGVTFTDCNDITIRTAKHLVILSDGSHVQYGPNVFNSDPSIRRNQAHLLRAPSTSTLWPGEFLELNIPDDASLEGQAALEPRTDADCYSSWLRPVQSFAHVKVTWLPCEVEALGIGAAIKHFSPFILQAHHPVSVLTDSKPYVQAYSKLSRGSFSSSARVATFLAIASRFQALIIENEKQNSLKETLISLCMDLHPLDGPLTVVYTDVAPGFVALVDDSLLGEHHICIEMGCVENSNKNPVEEKAIQELEASSINNQRTSLLNVIKQTLKQRHSRMKTNRQLSEIDASTTDTKDKFDSGVDFLTTVKLAVDKLPEFTTLVSNLRPEQIAEAIAKVVSTVIGEHVPKDCQHFVWIQIFVGSLKHTLELEFKRDFPKSFYHVISRWSNTVHPLISQESLNSSIVNSIVNMVYGPLMGWIDNFSDNLDMSESEKAFFDAVTTSIKATQSSCLQSNTITLRTTIVQLFKYAKDLKIFSMGSYCPDTATVMTGIDQLVNNIATHLKSNFINSLMMLDILRQPEIDSLLAYLERDYNIPEVLHLVFDLASSGDYYHFIENISETFTGSYLVRIIEDLTMDVDSDDFVGVIIKEFPDVDVFGLLVEMPKVERGYILTAFIKRLIRKLHEKCPGGALTELFLGFIHYTAYNLPTRNQLSVIINDVTQISQSKSIDDKNKPQTDRRHRREYVMPYSEQADLPLTNLYDILYLLQKVILDRIDEDLKPVLDKIALDKNTSEFYLYLDPDLQSAVSLFWRIENELISESPDSITLYQLLRDIEDIFLGHMDDMGYRVCHEPSIFLELKTLLQTAVLRMLKPLKAEDLYKLSSPMNSSKSLSLHNITVILNKMEQLLLPEIISLELVRVSDITRSDSISDVEQHLSEEITSVINEILRVTVDGYDPYEFAEPLTDLPVEYTIEQLFQYRKDEMMQTFLTSQHPVDTLSDFFIMFVDEARRRGVDTEQFLPDVWRRSNVLMSMGIRHGDDGGVVEVEEGERLAPLTSTDIDPSHYWIMVMIRGMIMR